MLHMYESLGRIVVDFNLFIVLVFYLVVTTQRGMPLRGSLSLGFRRVDITQHGVTRVVLSLCHVKKDGPRGGIQQSCLRGVKTDVLR